MRKQVIQQRTIADKKVEPSVPLEIKITGNHSSDESESAFEGPILIKKDRVIIHDEAEAKSNGRKVNILIAASEGVPFFVTGGLGEVIGALPKAIMKDSKERFDVRVVLPLYESISPQERKKMQFLGYFHVELAWRKQYCGVFRTEKDGIIYYFIDNEFYFKRAIPYGYDDDGERFAFFSKAVLESIQVMDFEPNIIHCHDWQTALIPVYLHYTYHHLHLKSLFTIHNIEYQGKNDLHMLEDIIGLPPEARGVLEYNGCVNLMKAAIECAYRVNTVSPNYAIELMNDYFAKGLARIIQRNGQKVKGILNGIDMELYNPETDPSIFVNYNQETIDKKKLNKTELQRLVNLPVEEKVPLFAIVSRLVTHKGIDIVAAMMEKLLSEKVQVVILGIGERKYEDYFKWLQDQYQGKVSSLITFNQDLARKIYAGADFFLMPSKSEPCGLAQMIASRYGTVPIVHAVGGLRDTIHDCSKGEGNGFVFDQYNGNDLLHAIYRGLETYKNEQDWNALVEWIMGIDFSWGKSAREYERLYMELDKVLI
ncbi:glycogen synthase [Robertmurraya yapensis]|uniref:Glycogen synthase n=1 Tax=Bacillus yapensis TaxID=2492960 RepID=A0A3S0KE71_9BACI|nr:glycogen/starch synthase [Bacillus yapensis]RTR28803.1 glycogen synthase [Bacillus yapensis]TKS94661.1 glycosyltransferase [Bacillus yapensis]